MPLAEAAVDSLQSDEMSTGVLVLVLLREATVHCLKADESSASLFKFVSVETPFFLCRHKNFQGSARL